MWQIEAHGITDRIILKTDLGFEGKYFLRKGEIFTRESREVGFEGKYFFQKAERQKFLEEKA